MSYTIYDASVPVMTRALTNLSKIIDKAVAQAKADDKPAVRIYDGLLASSECPETFPQCYFKGHAYPPGMENNPPPYCAEVYIRGLDSYVWSEGYIIRGPNAGTFSTAGIAYSAHHREQKTEKVFNGPFPQ